MRLYTKCGFGKCPGFVGCPIKSQRWPDYITAITAEKALWNSRFITDAFLATSLFEPANLSAQVSDCHIV